MIWRCIGCLRRGVMSCLLAWFYLYPLVVAIERPLFSLLITIGYGDTNLATFGRNDLHCVGCNELYPA